MTNSYYLGPNRARFTPATWDDIVTAADDGLLNESQWVELKKELPPKGPGANLELAKDLASLSLDGGVLIYGIEDNKGAAGKVTGARLEGLQSRIDATAKARIDPPLTITMDPFENPDDASLAVLVVTVPASKGAPHFVDGSAWGRGAEGKRVLSGSEIRRLLTSRVEQQERFGEQLHEVADVIGVDQADSRASYLHFLAVPAQSPLPPTITEVVGRSSLTAVFHNWFDYREMGSEPNILSLGSQLPHPDGIASKSYNDNSVSDEKRIAVLIGDDGSWRACNGAVIHNAGTIEAPTYFADSRFAVLFMHTLLVAIAETSTALVPLNCEWTIGVRLTNLKGVYPIESRSARFSSAGVSAYPRREYLRTTSATTQELTDKPQEVVERLLRPLLRSLSVDQLFFPYKELAEIN